MPRSFSGTGVSGTDYSIIFYFRFSAVLVHRRHKRYYSPSEISELSPLSRLSVFGELSINFEPYSRLIAWSDTKKSAFKSQNWKNSYYNF